MPCQPRLSTYASMKPTSRKQPSKRAVPSASLSFRRPIYLPSLPSRSSLPGITRLPQSSYTAYNHSLHVTRSTKAFEQLSPQSRKCYSVSRSSHDAPKSNTLRPRKAERSPRHATKGGQPLCGRGRPWPRRDDFGPLAWVVAALLLAQSQCCYGWPFDSMLTSSSSGAAETPALADPLASARQGEAWAARRWSSPLRLVCAHSYGPAGHALYCDTTQSLQHDSSHLCGTKLRGHSIPQTEHRHKAGFMVGGVVLGRSSQRHASAGRRFSDLSCTTSTLCPNVHARPKLKTSPAPSFVPPSLAAAHSALRWRRDARSSSSWASLRTRKCHTRLRLRPFQALSPSQRCRSMSLAPSVPRAHLQYSFRTPTLVARTRASAYHREPRAGRHPFPFPPRRRLSNSCFALVIHSRLVGKPRLDFEASWLCCADSISL